jgi:hypothetical protein
MGNYLRIATLSTLGFMLIFAVGILNAYGWDTRSNITSTTDASGETIITIAVDYIEMTATPSAGHHPTEFQIRTSPDGSQWTELTEVPINTIPPRFFNLTYNLGNIDETTYVQARVDCSIHGWSQWGPTTPVAITAQPTITLNSTTTTTTTSSNTTTSSTTVSTTSSSTTSSTTSTTSSSSQTSTTTLYGSTSGIGIPDIYIVGIAAVIIAAVLGFIAYRRMGSKRTS